MAGSALLGLPPHTKLSHTCLRSCTSFQNFSNTHSTTWPQTFTHPFSVRSGRLLRLPLESLGSQDWDSLSDHTQSVLNSFAAALTP